MKSSVVFHEEMQPLHLRKCLASCDKIMRTPSFNPSVESRMIRHVPAAAGVGNFLKTATKQIKKLYLSQFLRASLLIEVGRLI